MGNTPTGRKAQTIERVAERDDNANKNNNNNDTGTAQQVFEWGG